MSLPNNPPERYLQPVWIEFRRKHITPNNFAPIIKWAFETLANGCYSVEDIRRQCKDQGFDFKKSCFYKIFRNQVYCGKILIPAYKNEEIDQSEKGSISPVNSRILCKSSTSYCDVSPIGTTKILANNVCKDFLFFYYHSPSTRSSTNASTIFSNLSLVMGFTIKSDTLLILLILS